MALNQKICFIKGHGVAFQTVDWLWEVVGTGRETDQAEHAIPFSIKGCSPGKVDLSLYVCLDGDRWDLRVGSGNTTWMPHL